MLRIAAVIRLISAACRANWASFESKKTAPSSHDPRGGNRSSINRLISDSVNLAAFAPWIK